MRLNVLLMLIGCAGLAACTPSGVGVGVGGGGGHYGAGGGVGLYFPVDSGDGQDNVAQAAAGAAPPQGQGTGLGAAYPFHNCQQPQGLRPDRDDPRIFHAQYWRETDDYRRCIQDYIAKAKRDQQLIQERIEQAAQEYQQFLMFGN